MARPSGQNTMKPITIGIALGLFQFVFFCLMTWVYVRRANGEFDTLSEQIVQDAVRKA